MLILENRFDPGAIVFFVTDLETSWLVEAVGQTIDGRTVYNLRSGPESVVASEYEILQACDDENNPVSIETFRSAEDSDDEPVG